MFKRWRAFLLEKSKTTLVPFHVYDGSALIIHGLADYEELMAQTAGTGYAPVAAQLADGKGRKRGYAQLWIMQYADTTEGPYAEVVINFVVSRRQREYAWRSPYSSLVPMMDPDNRLFTIQLLLEEYEPTNLGAIEYGRQLFGLDKRKARISICQRAETRTFACRQGGKRALWGQVSTNNTLFDTVRDTTWLAQEIGILDCLKNAKQMRDGAELNGGMVTRDINNPGSTLEILAVYKFSPEILRWDPGGKLGWSAETSFGRILDAMDFQPKIACRDDRLRSVLYRKGWPVAEVA
jgi:hypothetical protein